MFLHHWLCFPSGLSLLRRTRLNLFPCWEVRKSLFSSSWSFQQPGDRVEGSCIQTWPQEIVHGCGNGYFKKALAPPQRRLSSVLQQPGRLEMAHCVWHGTDRRSGLWHTVRGFASLSRLLTSLLVRGSVVAVVRLGLGSLCPQ